MKKLLFISILLVLAIYVFRETVYKPYLWKKAMETPEHRLQLGSFVFSKQRDENGNSGTAKKYFVFKVTEITGDYVRFSIVRKLSDKGNIKSSDFSMPRETYRSFKRDIKKVTVTGILREDLNKEGGHTVNDYLLKKYPSLKKSHYYYEVIPKDEENIKYPKEYFNLIYSKEKIIEKRKLIPYTITDNDIPELARHLSQRVCVILN